MYFPRKSKIKINQKLVQIFHPEKDDEEWRKDHPIIIPLRENNSIF